MRVQQVVDEAEDFLVANFEKAISSQAMGERVATVVRRVDKVAYVRFASVYRKFEDVGEFIEEAQQVIEETAQDIPGQQSLFDPPEATREES